MSARIAATMSTVGGPAGSGAALGRHGDGIGDDADPVGGQPQLVGQVAHLRVADRAVPGDGAAGQPLERALAQPAVPDVAVGVLPGDVRQ